jgi:membrane protease YdiL (CAAX protease family)
VSLTLGGLKKLLEGLRTVDRDAAIALIYTAAQLSATEFWFLTTAVQHRINPRRGGVSLEAGATWSIATTVFEMGIPLLLIWFVHRRRVRDHGWRFDGFFRHIRVYVGMYAVMIPVIYWASRRQDFAQIYPFVVEARRDFSVFVKWEAFYLLQFFALESFFRGYLLFTLERSMGWNAIFVMAVPYCAIHWHKAPLECFAAIFAGILLGALALRFRSWYGGAVLHTLVAVTMDTLGHLRSLG